MKDGVARAIRTLRAAATRGPADRVAPLLPKMVGLRFQAAARARWPELMYASSIPYVWWDHHSVAVLAVCFVGEDLDDADVELQRREHH